MQKVFADNRAQLRHLDVDYPELGAEFMSGHHNLAWSFLPSQQLRGTETFTVDKFVNKIASCESSNILISSEEFENFSGNLVMKLSNLLSVFDVTIVVYIRNPLNALYSRWQEGIKHGETRSFYDYCTRISQNPALLNYLRVTNMWAQSFGQENLDIVIYDNLLGIKDISLYCLEKILGVDTDSIVASKSRVNSGKQKETIELLRHLNHIHDARKESQNIIQKFNVFLASPKGRQIIDQYLSQVQLKCQDARQLSTKIFNVFRDIERRFIQAYGPQVRNMAHQESLFVVDKQNEAEFEIPLFEFEMDKTNQGTITIEEIYEAVLNSSGA